MLNFKQYCCSPIFKICIFFFCFCGSTTLYSQADSLAVKSYDELVQSFFKTINKNPEKANTYITAAYKNAVKENDTNNIIDALSKSAYSKSLLTKNKAALQDIEKAISLARTLNNALLLSRIYNQKGSIVLDMGKHLDALDDFIKAKEYAVVSRDRSYEISPSANIAFIKQMNQAYVEAIAMYKENLTITNTIKIDTAYKNITQISSYRNLVDIYLRMQEVSEEEDHIKKAIYYNDLGLKICSKTEYPIYYYELKMNQAIIHFQEQKYDSSIELINEITVFAEEIKDEKLRATAYFYLGKNYDALENHSEAIQSLERFYTLLKNSEKTYSNERELHALLSWNYSKIEDREQSKFHFEEQNRLLLQERKKNIKVVSTIHTKHDIAEINKKVKVLEEEFQAQEKRKKLLYALAVFLVLLLIGSIVFYKLKVKRIQKKAAEVLQKVIALETAQEAQKTSKQKTVSSISDKVTDKKAALLLEKLTMFEEREEFLSLECSLGYVAEKLASNTSYVSNVINNYKHKTFKAYITELRINAALIRLKNDEKLRSYTIKAIAEEFGFKRQETFSKAFKAQTGIYPSQYLKKLRDDLEID
ncbi:AraC family transcriptional regulator [uncultured Kordia sp.]|uniref:AraC family transcriptional regulator n=1 Tax=uncultured Kordia sp. TaxID=507699 RepID=UPI002604E7EE|nr:AraC family transcriptional regulator [uncultured Kordia sp.]